MNFFCHNKTFYYALGYEMTLVNHRNEALRLLILIESHCVIE